MMDFLFFNFFTNEGFKSKKTVPPEKTIRAGAEWHLEKTGFEYIIS
jgi:hypothetical protein